MNDRNVICVNCKNDYGFRTSQQRKKVVNPSGKLVEMEFFIIGHCCKAPQLDPAKKGQPAVLKNHKNKPIILWVL